MSPFRYLYRFIVEEIKMDEKEFSDKYNLYSKMIYSIIYGYTLDIDDSNDILQDVFMKYLKLNKEFNDLDSEKYYLIRITINCCNDYYKNKKKTITLDKDIADTSSSNRELKYIVKKLPNKYKEVIIMHYYENLDIKSISSILKINSSTVKKRLERARNMIKEEIGDNL